MKRNNIFDSENNPAQACPVSHSSVDKHLIKAYSSTVLIVLLFSLFTASHLPLYLITIDFMIRVIIGIKYSPLCNILTYTLRIMPLKPLLVNAGSKKIAAQVGLVFCILICLFHWLSLPFYAIVTTLMFIFAISIDLLFDYCLACKLQQLMKL